MGILDSIKNTLRSMKNKVFGNTEPPKAERKMLPVEENPTPQPADTSRYLHVSVPLIPIENAMLRKLLGRDYMPGRGVTYNVGNNAMKRAVDELGLPNKQRRRLRSQVKRRAQELALEGAL